MKVGPVPFLIKRHAIQPQLEFEIGNPTSWSNLHGDGGLLHSISGPHVHTTHSGHASAATRSHELGHVNISPNHWHVHTNLNHWHVSIHWHVITPTRWCRGAWT